MIEIGQIRVVSGPGHEAAAAAWAEQLRARSLEAATGAVVKGDLVVAVLRAADVPAKANTAPAPVLAALDLGLHVVIVQDAPFALPKLIDHVRTVVGTPADEKSVAALVSQIAAVGANGVPLPLKVLTPNARRANRSAGAFVGGLALMMFIIGVIGVGVFGLQRPADEYEALDTAVALTRDWLAGPELLYFSTWLPRSTEDAANYSATLQQLPTAYRPLMGLTVTAYAQGTPLPPIATPSPLD